ncbi:hypothetical protein [Neisseria weixii]|uniref:hypothetical protein n=1 Tax=Neisseria weixii TaxID=1853276 RepID=UPI00359FACC7
MKLIRISIFQKEGQLQQLGKCSKFIYPFIKELKTRTLTNSELNNVSGGWVANAAGAVLGGYAGGYGYLAAGGKNPNGFFASVAGGAAGGVLSPVRGMAMGARAVASGLASAGVNTYLSK